MFRIEIQFGFVLCTCLYVWYAGTNFPTLFCRFSLFLVGRNRRVNFEEKVTFSMSRYERCVIYSESNDLSNDKPFHAIFINLGEKNRVVPLSWVKCWNLKNLSTYPQSTLVKIGPCSSNLCYPNLFIHLLRLQLRKWAFP